MHLSICSRCKKQTIFSGKKYLGGLRVNVDLSELNRNVFAKMQQTGVKASRCKGKNKLHLIARKPVLRVSNKVRLKHTCPATETRFCM